MLLWYAFLQPLYGWCVTAHNNQVGAEQHLNRMMTNATASLLTVQLSFASVEVVAHEQHELSSWTLIKA